MLSWLRHNGSAFAAIAFYGFVLAWPSLKAPAQQQSHGTANEQNVPANQKEAPVISTPSMQVLVSGSVNVNSADKAGAVSNHASESPQSIWDWFVKFMTDIKITDVLLAGFTFVLAIYTARLFIATATLAE